MVGVRSSQEASWVAELHEIEDSDEAGVPLAIPSENKDNSKCIKLHVPDNDTPCCSNSLV